MTRRKQRTRPAAFFMGNPRPLAQHGAVAVIGLGRFGGSLATELAAYGVDVIGIDIEEAVVAQYSDKLAFVSRADATDETVLSQLGIKDVSRVVIAIGSDLEASILTASKVLKIGNRHIWAKAVSQAHADILGQLGIENVIRPENDMGRRIAHLIRGHMSDFMPVSEDFVLAPDGSAGAHLRRAVGIIRRPTRIRGQCRRLPARWRGGLGHRGSGHHSLCRR